MPRDYPPEGKAHSRYPDRSDRPYDPEYDARNYRDKEPYPDPYRKKNPRDRLSDSSRDARLADRELRPESRGKDYSRQPGRQQPDQRADSRYDLEREVYYARNDREARHGSREPHAGGRGEYSTEYHAEYEDSIEKRHKSGKKPKNKKRKHSKERDRKKTRQASLVDDAYGVGDTDSQSEYSGQPSTASPIPSRVSPEHRSNRRARSPASDLQEYRKQLYDRERDSPSAPGRSGRDVRDKREPPRGSSHGRGAQRPPSPPSQDQKYYRREEVSRREDAPRGYAEPPRAYRNVADSPPQKKRLRSRSPPSPGRRGNNSPRG